MMRLPSATEESLVQHHRLDHGGRLRRRAPSQCRTSCVALARRQHHV